MAVGRKEPAMITVSVRFIAVGGGDQILAEDPAGNPVELFQPRSGG
jgi:hypothetical protein